MIDQRSDEAVYGAHASELVRFATGLVGRDDAPDVVAEAFVRVVASPVWADARDRRALWFRAVVFEAKSWRRSAARRRARERGAASGDCVVATQPERDDEVVAALELLSVQQRAVVVLTYWADLDPAGIGELLGVAEGTVRKQLARARKKLKGELGHE